jgi:hypothetical protein
MDLLHLASHPGERSRPVKKRDFLDVILFPPAVIVFLITVAIFVRRKKAR